jgi:hypothetical protein
VYRRSLDDMTLTIAVSGWTWRDTFVLYDRETFSLWFGGAGPVGVGMLRCIAGPLEGATLPVREHYRAIWRSQIRADADTKFVKVR